MKKIILLFILSLVFISCKNENQANSTENNSTQKKAEFAIVIHGGAGPFSKEDIPPEIETRIENKLKEAITAGYDVLKKGGSSLDAVQTTIIILEDSPLFNAGKGAVFTNEETNEHDTSIMDGKTLNAGASARTTIVKNPINLARAVMDNSPHVLLSGKGAENFAKEQGLEIVDPSYFFTERNFKDLQWHKEHELFGTEKIDKTTFNTSKLEGSKYGTVGCVALDKNGNLAAGTSTGGMTNKRWGRIGDSPIIGSGTYANNNTCAISSTGWGEYFIRTQVAYDISALMDYKGSTLKEAAEIVMEKVKALGGDGGVIAVDKNGNMVTEFNSEGMFRATMNDKGELNIEMYRQN